MNSYKTIDEYIKNYPEDIQEVLQKIKEIAKDVIPNAEEAISYGVPTMKLNGKYVVYFAAFKTHISVYPVFDTLEKELPAVGEYRKGKGTLQFPLTKPMPYELIRKIIALLLKANLARNKKIIKKE